MTTISPPLDLWDARALLSFLAGLEADPGALVTRASAQADLARWLIAWELAPLAERRLAAIAPQLAHELRADRYSTLAHNTLHWQNLAAIDAAFVAGGLTAVLLKGAALAGTVYEEPAQRAMGDVDLWLTDEQMAAACAIMPGLGFRATESAARPLALQALADGEVQYVRSDQPATLVELHLSPFAGWWLQRTAAVDTAAVWARCETLPSWAAFRQLDPQDTVIHLAVHTAINHQFGLAAVRSLMDIALTAQMRLVDWGLVVQRAREWRVATAVWLVLSLLQELLGLDGLAAPLEQLQPPAWRRRRLQKMVSPASVLEGTDIREERSRFQLLLLLVDRPQDAARLVYRTLWPEAEWLAARYGRAVPPWQHLRRVLRHRTI